MSALSKIRQTVNSLPDSPTWVYVVGFALRMEKKLAKNRHKGDREGWLKMSRAQIWGRIQDETKELGDALGEGNVPEDIANECADIANFAMMLADKVTAEELAKKV